MKKTLIFILVLIMHKGLFAQIINGKDPMLDTLFKHSIKSLDEFIARFNGTENNPNISKEEKEYRENNILALFNKEWIMKIQEKEGEKNQTFNDISEFIKTVCNTKQQLSADDSLFFAEAQLKVKYQNKEKLLNIILKMEDTGGHIYRWSICGVNGLIENQMLDTVINTGIRPIDHEMNFMQLRGILANANNNMTNYRSQGTDIDPLSYFFALVKAKQIQFVQCNAVVYHFFNVKGYYFKVEKFNRQDYNSGWLVSDFKKITEKEKINYLTKIFDK